MTTKLYTVGELHERLPKGTTTPAKLQSYIKKAGTYRDVGGAVLLTDGDWRQYLEWSSARKRKQAIEPGAAEVGIVSVIVNGETKEPRSALLWTVRGDEVEKLKEMSNSLGQPLGIYVSIDMTYGEYLELIEALKKSDITSWRGGFWFDWTKELRDRVWKKVTRDE
jgi:hypothetical protein